MREVGANAFFANHNIFASEEVFRPLPDVRIEFDAIYNARPTPQKRHELTSFIERIAYISFFEPAQDAFNSRSVISELLMERPGRILANAVTGGYTKRMDPKAVNDWLARASVGLCLSAAEGAMYASIEYLLAGLPIVSTPSRGGRDVFFDPDYCIITAPEPRAVREAVEALRDRNIPRSHVRARTLEKLTRERGRLLTFIDEIKARHGVPLDQWTGWSFSGTPFHEWRSVDDHARNILGSAGDDTMGGERARREGQASKRRRKPKRHVSVRRLVSFVGQNDSDILPFFLDHYRRLGIGAFHIIVHGTWSKAELAPLYAGDVTIEGIVSEAYDGELRRSALDAVARQFVGEWILVVDADEFMELPYTSLERTIEAMIELGMQELPANLLQRAAPDGVLHTLSEGPPEELFTCYDYRLAERMGTEFPVWKSKYTLVRVGPAFCLHQGSHHPSNGRAAMHVPIRGVLHHFKWRDRLLRSIARQRGEVGKQQGNQEEQNAYHRWLYTNNQRLPTEGLRPCSRSALLREGHLIVPTRSELNLWSTLRKAREGGQPTAGSLPNALPQPEIGMLDRKGFGVLPGRIALVTNDLLGLRRTGGIGTAMTALAERLGAEGHDVHVFLCPWGHHNWHKIWTDHWSARHCQVHYHPLREGWSTSDASMLIADTLNATDWDVIHFAENGGLGAPVLLLRAAGLAFQNTQVVITAHGPTRWARHGNLLPWTDSEALGSELEERSFELGDSVVCPSEYIAEWCRNWYAMRAAPIVVPNSMTGETRRFGRGRMGPRPIERIVFFGRIELRKGIDRFLAAIDRVLADGLSDFEVVFMGSFAGYYPSSELTRRTQDWPCRTRILSNYTSHDAIDFLRTENCIAVMPSRLDNSPYCVFECLDNAVPFIATDVGGVAELIHADDRARVLVSGDPDEIAAKLIDALRHGAAPARLPFDPSHADVDLLALHGNLVERARASRGDDKPRAQQKASVIVYGQKADVAALPMAEWLGRLGGASIEVLWSLAPQGDAVSDWHGAANALNQAARAAAHDRLLFCHTSSVPDPHAANVLLTALEQTGSDAAVCGYRFQGSDGVSNNVAVFAAPSELSAQRNIYGARLFLVRKAAFLANGGFSDDPNVASILEWDFLNRMKAAGRRVIGVPAPLVSVAAPVAPAKLTESQAGALTVPWTEAAPLHLQGFMRMGLHSDRSQRSEASPGGHAPIPDARPVSLPHLVRPSSLGAVDDDRAVGSLLAGMDPAEDRLTREGRLRIGADGRLLDASETFLIRSAADADACDFLVEEGLLDGERASSLVQAFQETEEQLLRTNSGRPPTSSFLWMRELAASRPSALATVVDLVRDGAARTACFYGLDGPLYPDLIKLTKLGKGMSAMPPRRSASARVISEEQHRGGFAGQVFVSDCQGGVLYFTGLDMAVEPKLGRFVAATSGAYHEQALLRVEEGALLVLSFAMRFSREQISLHLRGIF